MHLFDTTYLVDLVNGDREATEFGRKVDEEASLAAISAISVHEYLFGVHYRYGREEEMLKARLASAENDLARFEVIPLTEQIASTSCKIHADLVRVGSEIGINDVYIAATAINYNLPLVTRNKSHFERIPNLKLEPY